MSCTSATACTAVGYNAKSTFAPLVERWNGASWVVQTVPYLAGLYPNSVSCEIRRTP